MRVVILTLLSALLVQTGYFLWRLSARDLPRLGEAQFFTAIWSYLTDFRWMLGLILRLSGLALFIKVSSFGDLSLIQPLMSAGDVFLVMMAVCFLKEKLLLIEGVGLAITIAGAVALSIGANAAPAQAVPWEEVLWFVFISCLVLVGALLFCARSSRAEVFIGIAAGTALGIGSVLIKLLTTLLVLAGKPVDFYHCVINPMFVYVEFFNITGVLLLQLAFQDGRAAIVVPIELATMSCMAVLGGLMLFGESVGPARWCGIVLVAAGSVFLQQAASERRVRANG